MPVREARLVIDHLELGGSPFGLVVGQPAEPIGPVAAPGSGPTALEEHARRAVAACPTLALLIVPVQAD